MGTPLAAHDTHDGVTLSIEIDDDFIRARIGRSITPHESKVIKAYLRGWLTENINQVLRFCLSSKELQELLAHKFESAKELIAPSVLEACFNQPTTDREGV